MVCAIGPGALLVGAKQHMRTLEVWQRHRRCLHWLGLHRTDSTTRSSELLPRPNHAPRPGEKQACKAMISTGDNHGHWSVPSILKIGTTFRTSVSKERGLLNFAPAIFVPFSLGKQGEENLVTQGAPVDRSATPNFLDWKTLLIRHEVLRLKTMM